MNITSYFYSKMGKAKSVLIFATVSDALFAHYKKDNDLYLPLSISMQ